MTKQEQEHIFSQWLNNYKALFFKVITAFAFTPMDRDDLFQEITMQVWHSVPSFKSQSSLSTWLYRIALNTAIKWTQKEQKHRILNETLENVDNVLLENGKPLNEQLAWLYENLSQLNEIDRSVILLLLDGLSYKEIAGILGITESNVGVKINRIKKNLVIKSKKMETYGI